MLRPLHDRVLVRRKEVQLTTAGGILLSAAHAEKPQEGTVVAVGPGRLHDEARIALDVAPGDHIVFGKWSGTEITVDGETLLIMQESDILGILTA